MTKTFKMFIQELSFLKTFQLMVCFNRRIISDKFRFMHAIIFKIKQPFGFERKLFEI